MKIAVIGKGGREAALSWKLAQSVQVESVHVLPGNPGMQSEKIICHDHQTTDDIISFLQNANITYCVVGQEKYLAEGLIDRLLSLKIACIGPSKVATQLESSKRFCKEVFIEAGLPTADFLHFSSLKKLKEFAVKEVNKRPLVLKWDYLADGKGVFVCFDALAVEEALLQLDRLAKEQRVEFSVIVEDFLEGREFSAFCLVDGDGIRYFSSACDYKRLTEDPKSPNTGGMGTYSPALVVENEEELIVEYAEKLVATLKAKNIYYHGFLFFGCLQAADTTYLLEINTRLGDPETQVLLPRLQSDLAETLQTLAKRDGSISKAPVVFSNEHALHIVKADPNYPFGKRQRVKIRRSDAPKNIEVFYAGVEKENGELVTCGGRVLGITGMAPTREGARRFVYANSQVASFQNEYFRKDIGC